MSFAHLLPGLLFLGAGCTSVTPTARLPREETSPETEPDSVDTGADTLPDTGVSSEEIPDAENPAAFLFTDEDILALELSIPGPSRQALSVDPYTYTDAELTFEGETWPVGVRLKGNVCYRTLSQKAAFKVKFNYYDDEGRFYGLKHLTLNNLVYDPSMMHEHLAYQVYREAGLQAPRLGYFQVTVDGEYYGLYALIDTMDDIYIEQWWEDGSGPMYESGSHNYPCDLSYGPDCWEVDEAGTQDNRLALGELCSEATVADDDQFVENMKEALDWENFLYSMAMEVAVSHYDSYSWNMNNFHIYHEPTLDKWYWSPWSTDLAWGWYPWSSVPTCGSYGVDPDEYQTGYVAQRCKAHRGCHLEFLDYLEMATDHLESMDVPARVDETYERIRDLVYADPRKEYSDEDFENDVSCVRSYAQGRPEYLRAYIEQKRHQLGAR